MFVRMTTITRMSSKRYRLTLDVVDPERDHWDYGDCQLQVDLWDEPSHRAQPRGPLTGAFEIYRLSRNDPPAGAEAKLLWDIGQAVEGFVKAPIDAQERSE